MRLLVVCALLALAGRCSGVSLAERWALNIEGAEVVGFDRASGRGVVAGARGMTGFAVSAAGATRAWSTGVEQLAPPRLKRGAATHVAVDPAGRGFAAVTVKGAPEERGVVVFLDLTDGRVLGFVGVGFAPDAASFSADGSSLVVANEGEPGDAADPAGSVSVVRLGAGALELERAPVEEIALETADGLRVHPARRDGPARDLEPEYVCAQGGRAYVTLQENNGVAVVDIASASLAGVHGLGAVEVELDPSDEDGRRGPYERVTALPMPDQVASFERFGRPFLVTADEGDDRGDWGESELGDVARLGALTADGRVSLRWRQRVDSSPGLARLEVCAHSGDADGDGVIDEPRALGTRGVSVWDARTLERVGGTGSALERAMAEEGAWYNATGADEPETDGRSDNRGPEPEGVVVGEVDGAPVAFVGLERPGAIAAVDLRDPRRPRVASLEVAAARGHYAVEGLCFVPAERSPFAGPMLLAAFEGSGEVVAYEVVRGERP